MKFAGFAKLFGVVAVVLSVSGCLWAPDLDRVRKDLEKQMPGVEFDRRIALSLGPVALTLVRGALSLATDSPDTREVAGYMRDIHSVGVAVYTAHDVPGDLDLRLPKALEKLVDGGGWEIVVKTREDGEAVWVLCMMDGDTIKGLYVVALDEEELVLVRAKGRLEEMFKKAIRDNVRPGRLARHVEFNGEGA